MIRPRGGARVRHPQLGAHLFNTTNVILSGIGIVAPAGSAALAQLLLGRTAPGIGASAGSIALAVGMILIVVAATTDSSAIYLIGSILGGIGFGIAYLGGLQALVAVIPHEHRAAVMSDRRPRGLAHTPGAQPYSTGGAAC